jgi:hypothetical protein
MRQAGRFARETRLGPASASASASAGEAAG